MTRPLTRVLTGLLLVAAGAAAGAAVSASAQDVNGRDSFGRKIGPALGVVPGPRVDEEFRIMTGVDAEGRPSDERRIRQSRHVVKVPTYFGEFVTITASGSDSIAWYRDAGGVLRNVVVSRAGSQLYRVERSAVSGLETDYR